MITKMQHQITPILGFQTMDVLLSALILATLGSFLQIGGTAWDVTSHLLQRPETFFTPSHALLYTGVGLIALIAVLCGTLLILKKELRSKPFAISLKMFIIGSGIALVAGPADFWWHQQFGIDGLLSPTHFTLAMGMLINSLATVLGLTKIEMYFSSKKKKLLIRAALIPAFASLWYTAIWCVHLFSLPFSHGQHFNFNLNPISESIIAIIGLPLISSIMFIAVSKTIGGINRFGYSSAAAIVLIGINLFAGIIPSYKDSPLFLWYILLSYSAVIIADVLLNTPLLLKGEVLKILFTGAIIGSAFYLIDFPWINLTLAYLLFPSHQIVTDLVANTIPYFLMTLPTATFIAIIPGAVIGSLGSLLLFYIQKKRLQIIRKNPLLKLGSGNHGENI
jgi:hypothetical protein